jgi:hypothetical protein
MNAPGPDLQGPSIIRPAAVAGLFYSGDAGVLAADIRTYLSQAKRALPGEAPPKAVIVPHAGFIYSGATAAQVYTRLVAGRGRIERVVLLGPTHRVPVRGVAVPEGDAFETPLGRVAIDRATIAQLRNMPQIRESDAVHAFEHSLEVQLPFLQTVLGEFTLVPLAVGDATPHEVEQVMDRVWGGPETLIVVSSDLSHYHSYPDARRIDQETVQHIMELAPILDFAQACGAVAINALLLCARYRNLHPTLLDLRNSGDTAGDKLRVVGYAGVVFT